MSKLACRICEGDCRNGDVILKPLIDFICVSNWKADTSSFILVPHDILVRSILGNMLFDTLPVCNEDNSE